jgi:hypothetical protein
MVYPGGFRVEEGVAGRAGISLFKIVRTIKQTLIVALGVFPLLNSSKTSRWLIPYRALKTY